jgi:hypothetical protein
MLRRAVVVTFMLAIGLAACGRQVTPSPTFSNLDGRMVIQFYTNGTMDFNDYNYVVVFNTCGTGGEPYPNAYATTFLNYSYAFAVGATYGGFTTVPTLFQYLVTAGASSALNPTRVPIGASTVSAIYPLNGQTNQFQITFQRAQLNNPLDVTDPCPSGTPAPTASPSPSPTSAPTPTPVISPTAGPSATPTAIPSPSPTPNYNVNVWYINFFTIDRSNVVQDSLGVGGASDTTYYFTIDTTKSSQNAITRPSGSTFASNPAAAIAGGQINNYP